MTWPTDTAKIGVSMVKPEQRHRHVADGEIGGDRRELRLQH